MARGDESYKLVREYYSLIFAVVMEIYCKQYSLHKGNDKTELYL